MPSYVVLFQFTEKGIQGIKQSPDRVASIKQQFRDAGAEVKAFYALLGRYDTLFIAEAPDDMTMARLVARMGSAGYVRSETMPAFTEDEFRRITADLP